MGTTKTVSAPTENVVFGRTHRIMSIRREQITLNMLALYGGHPYISARLWRAQNEGDKSWLGDPKSGRVGRRDRTCLVNDAGRIASKISHYIFKNSVERKGIDELWASHCGDNGQNIVDFWRRASDLITAGGWCWLQTNMPPLPVDPETGIQRQRTLAEKAADGAYVNWTAWPACSVPDWCVGDDGRIKWLITEELEYTNDNPLMPAVEQVLRTLWRIDPVSGNVTFTEYTGGKGKESDCVCSRPETQIVGLKEIPFVLVGRPTIEPWWFDDVEMIQANIMNLESVNSENLFRSVFPQLVISSHMLDSLQARLEEKVNSQSGEKFVEIVKDLVRGLDYPVVETSEDKGITRFIQPVAADQLAIPNENDRRRKMLFDVVGLSLFNNETRQAQTVESKKFDMLDTESTLKNRAITLQHAEEELVRLSKLVDSTFAVYKPIWPVSFDVVDVSTNTNAIAMLENLPDLTPTMRKIVMTAALRVVSEIAGIDQTKLDDAQREIDAIGSDDKAEEPVNEETDNPDDQPSV